MTILFVDGFDHQDDTTDLTSGDDWTTAVSGLVISASYARFNGKGLGFITPSGFPQFAKELSTNYSSLVVGFAYNSLSAGDSNCIALRLSEGGSASNEQVTVTFNALAAGQITVYKGNAGGTVLGSVNNVSAINGVWCYCEVEATFSPTAGSVNVYVNGNLVLSLANVDTDPNGTGNANLVSFNQAAGGATFYIDDVYIMDPTTGSSPWNSPLGPQSTYGGVSVETVFPNANSSVTWTPLANENWQEVSETTFDGDTTYNYDSDPAGDTDLFTVGELSSQPTEIYAVAQRTGARLDSGSFNLRNVIKSGSTTSNGSTVALGSSYAYQTTINQTDPNTSAQWSYSGVTDLLIGYQGE